MTKRTLEALAIIAQQPHIAAAEFAKLFWPGHPMHDRVKRNGVRGCGAWLAAGSYLAKLRDKDLVTKYFEPGYTLKAAGRAALADNQPPTT